MYHFGTMHGTVVDRWVAHLYTHGGVLMVDNAVSAVVERDDECCAG